MKSLVVAILFTIAFVGSANAESTSPKPQALKLSSALKPIGVPDITAGPVAKGQVFYRRKLTYWRTGVLTTPLALTGAGGDVTLSKGTPVFAVPPQWPYQGDVIWCTLMQKDVQQVCLLHYQGKPIWAIEKQDVTFTASVILSTPIDSAPEPAVDETAPPAMGDFTVEIGLGDPDVLNKPIPLTNGTGYIVSSPITGMAVTYRYLDAGVEKLFGWSEYPQPVDVMVDGAELHYDPTTKTYSASASMAHAQDAIPANPVSSASQPAPAPSISTLARLAPWATQIVAQRDQPAVAFAGTVTKGGKILAIPFRYLRPLRLSGDMVQRNIFGMKVTIAPKGAIGFDAGNFSGGNNVGLNGHVRCFFADSRGPQYFWADPICYSAGLTPPVAAPVYPDTNVPTTLHYPSQGGVVYLVPDVEEGNFTADHDFELNLTFLKWIKGGAEVQWMSDGITQYPPIELFPGPDGKLTLPVNNGVMTIEPVPGDTKSATVLYSGS